MCMGSGLCCGWLQCTLYLLTEHGRYYLSCLYAETVESMRSAGSAWYVWYVWYMVCMVCWSFKLCCEILLLLNMADMDRSKTME